MFWPATAPLHTMKNVFHTFAVMSLCCLASICLVVPGAEDPFEDLDHPKPKKADPFEDLDNTEPKPAPTAKPPEEKKSWAWKLLHENFSFKKELYFQFTYSSDKANAADDFPESVYSRQSAGFELQKKFSTSTATVATFDYQGRVVRRDTLPTTHEIRDGIRVDEEFAPVNDHEGLERTGWTYETHNAYWDIYNIFNPFMDDATRGEHVGRFNFRVGHFYLPFGINLQTDTHGTVLQLSNDRNFGFERDWYAGLWGSVTPDLNYDVYYLLGSGSNIQFKGQSGMAGARFSLANKYFIEHGIEGGFAFMGGERIDSHAVEHSASVARDSNRDKGHAIVDTVRFGPDWRYTRSVPSGSLSLTTELSGGRDESDAVFTQLYQVDYLSRRRQWGLSTQYRRFWQDMTLGVPTNGGHHAAADHRADASVFGEFTWYFRNDIGNTNLHWIKLNVEHETEYHQNRKLDTRVTIQYYKYW